MGIQTESNDVQINKKMGKNVRMPQKGMKSQKAEEYTAQQTHTAAIMPHPAHRLPRRMRTRKRKKGGRGRRKRKHNIKFIE